MIFGNEKYISPEEKYCVLVDGEIRERFATAGQAKAFIAILRKDPKNKGKKITQEIKEEN